MQKSGNAGEDAGLIETLLVGTFLSLLKFGLRGNAGEDAGLIETKRAVQLLYELAKVGMPVRMQD